MALQALTMRFAYEFFKKIVQNRYMLRCIVTRDLSSRYTGSFMGFFWAVLHPLTMVLTYSFIFSYIFKARLGPEAGTTNFTLWLFCGMMPWLFFAESVQTSNNILLANSSLITKTLFPSELFPLSVILSNLVNQAIILSIILILIFVVVGKLTLFILFLPLYVVILSFFSLGLSWIAASLNLFVRDVGQIIIVIINFWFFYTPIMYEFSNVPKELQFLIKLNPMYHAVEGYRLALLGTGYPSGGGLLYLGGVSIICFVLGGLIFRRLKPGFAEVL